MQSQKSQPLGMFVTVLVLAVGGSLYLYGCSSLPAGSDSPETVTSTMTTTYTPTSTASASPTVTLTVTLTPTLRPTPTGTPDVRVLNPANQHLYLYVKEGKTWHEAKDHCAARGGHLVTIQAPSENLFVYNLSSDNNLRGIWLGATDELQEGNWVWVTGEPWKYSNWYKNRRYSEPDNQWGNDSSGANYLFLMWDKTWYDVTNGGYPYFVCEWEPASP